MIIKPEKEVSKALYEQIVALKDKEACYRFFQDLCSITELRAMEQRYDVAKLLYEGKVYTDIVETTGASSATISRVNRCLQYGADGYQTILPRLDPIWEEKKHRDTEA